MDAGVETPDILQQVIGTACDDSMLAVTNGGLRENNVNGKDATVDDELNWLEGIRRLLMRVEACLSWLVVVRRETLSRGRSARRCQFWAEGFTVSAALGTHLSSRERAVREHVGTWLAE